MSKLQIQKSRANARLSRSYELITQQLLQQLGDLQAQCKPLELYHQHGSQL
ncbi:hypothetical protein VIPARAQ4037_0616, partial [Vibrio parahaemolyticus AQ4037]